MAKNDNRDEVGNYLAEVEQNNKKIQLHLGHPWYKGTKEKIQEEDNPPKQYTWLAVSIFLSLYALAVYFFYIISPGAEVLCLIFGAVFGLMLYDSSRKRKR